MLLFLLGLFAGASLGFVAFAIMFTASKEVPLVRAQDKVPLMLVE